MAVADSPARGDLTEREGKMGLVAGGGEVYWDLVVWRGRETFVTEGGGTGSVMVERSRMHGSLHAKPEKEGKQEGARGEQVWEEGLGNPLNRKSSESCSFGETSGPGLLGTFRPKRN